MPTSDFRDVCFSAVLWALVAATAIGEARAAATLPAERPNVLLIMTDQQHAGMLSCAGNPYVKTPAMDSLAASGVRFARAYCGNPVCVPSRFSMMTGVLPSRIGMDRNGPNSKPLTPEILQHALGNVFRAGGYETVYGGKVHLPGAKRGAENYGFRYLTQDEREGLAETCCEFLQQKHERPFLLVASFINPHDICYMAIDAYASGSKTAPAFPGSTRERECLAEALRLPADVSREEFFARLCPPLPANFEIPPDEPPAVRESDFRPFRRYVQDHWSAESWRLHRWAYARLTERVDGHISKVLAALQAAGLSRKTVVALVSDHGDMDASHKLEHKSMPYEEAMNVPLIVSWPGVTRAGHVDKTHLVSTGLDLIPTLCDFAGIAIPPALRGRSVKKLSIAPGALPPWRDSLVAENERSRVLWTERYKYAVYDRGQRREMLVDLQNDPGELRNLAADPAHRLTLDDHRRRLRLWYRDHGETLDGQFLVDSPQPSTGRYVLQNDSLRLVFDDFGRLVEIFNKQTATACTSTSHHGPAPLFMIDAYSANQRIFIEDPLLKEGGGFCNAEPGLLYSVKQVGDLQRLTLDASRRPEISLVEKDGVPTLTCRCRLDGGIDLTYTVCLPERNGVSKWQVSVRNTADVKPRQQLRVYRVAFPILSHLCVGNRPTENVLARTFVQGELIPNPSQHSFIRPNRPGRFTNVLTYPGWASMPWMDLYVVPADNRAAAHGLYFASYDPTFQQTDIEAVPDALGKTMTLGMRTLAFAEPGQEWRSQTFVLATHPGDWHWAADRYRADSSAWFHDRDVPEWIKYAHGWFGTGVPNYKYADLPKMLEQARWLGLNYLQCWSEMLENVGPDKKRKAYYCFLLPDPDRGGEKEMEAGVKKVRELGGHIGFYSNFWTWDADAGNCLQQWKAHIPADVKIPYWHEFRNYMSVWPDGHIEAGDFDSGYAGACPGAKGWRDYLRFWVVDKYVKQYGVDAWYFDSFPVTMFGAARVCFSPRHADGRPHGVGPSLVEFARMIRQESDPTVKLAATSESVGDVFMQYNSHALGLELIDGLTQFQSPQVYTYTFPQHLIFSGSCNGAGSGLKYYYPEVEDGGTKKDTYNRVFLMGYRFDILAYGYSQSNPDVLHLRGLIAIREKIKDHWYRSSFRDEIGLGELPAGVHAKVFRHDEGRSLTVALIDRRESKSPIALSVDLARLAVAGMNTSVLYTLDGKEIPLVTNTVEKGMLQIAVPTRHADPAAIVISKD